MTGGLARAAAVGAYVAAAMLVLVMVGRKGARPAAGVAPIARLASGGAIATLRSRTGVMVLRRSDARPTEQAFELGLAIVRDGAEEALEVRRRANLGASEPSGNEVRHFEVISREGTALSLTMRSDPADEAISLELDAAPPPTVATTVALRASVHVRRAFVPGAGNIADVASLDARFLLLGVDDSARAELLLAASTSRGTLAVRASPEGDGVRVALTTPSLGPGHRADLRLALAGTPARAWSSLFAALGGDALPVRGRVTLPPGLAAHARSDTRGAWDGGARATAGPSRADDVLRVLGVDARGATQVDARPDVSGRFEAAAPPTVDSWYATFGTGRSSDVVKRVGDAPLTLDVRPGAELRARVVDLATQKPITARLVVRGIDGTPDPSFGPDYRASGAGPIVEALRGEIATPLPPGRYRVLATKGIEWSIDERPVELLPGHGAEVLLALSHVLPTPGVVGCDLHVHARPSFDTLVTPEDRVLSLVAAGIDFAVPSEHNLVGDYGPALSTLDLGRELAWVPGVEVTTYTPRTGHFGVFPFPLTKSGAVPPYASTTVPAILAAARRGDPERVVQINHPRMPDGVGYFEQAGFPARAASFDAIEVYNGYDLGHPERVDEVVRDWYALLDQGVHLVATGSSDAHGIQYHWAGYPRTFVDVGREGAAPLDVVAAIKRGRVVVSTGPLIDLVVDGARPGDTLSSSATGHVRARVRLLAAPWIDVTHVDLVAGSRTVRTLTAKITNDVVRLDEEIDLDLGTPRPTWLVAVARGTRTMDDVLPFMPVQPFALTNPIFLAPQVNVPGGDRPN